MVYPLGLWVVLIFWASFAPPRSKSARAFTFGGRDFPAHAIAYFVLSVLLFGLLVEMDGGKRAVVPVCFVLPVVLGGIIELIQPVVGRGRSWRDVLANALGAGAGTFLAFLAG